MTVRRCLVTFSVLLLQSTTLLAQEVTQIQNWRCQSSTVNDNGSAISGPNYNDSNWYNAGDGVTVMAALLSAGEYGGSSAVFQGINLTKVDSLRFKEPWWYRAVLPSSAALAASIPVLDIRGLNYKAELWCDGRLLANNSQLIGTFRRFLQPLPQGAAVVALKIWRQQDRSEPAQTHDTDLAITFVDWAPPPPDSNLGLFRNVYLLSYGAGVLLDGIGCNTSLSAPVERGALTGQVTASIVVTVHNFNAFAVSATLTAQVQGSQAIVRQPLSLAANAQSTVMLPDLSILRAPLWWPWRMGQQSLVNVTVNLTAAGGQLLATTSAPVGLRQVNSILDDNGYRLFLINGYNFAIFGGGYSPDLFLRRDGDWQPRHLIMARDLGLNGIRLEGKMEDDDFFTLADQLGLVILPGWCCCDAWQHWPYWKDEQDYIANESMRTQLRRFRSHPSVIVFLYGSDEAPPPDIEANFLAVARQEYWFNPLLSSASNRTTPGAGNTGVKMAGPYAWVPPVYWEEGLVKNKYGGAFGFSTEISPGAAPLLLDATQHYVGQDHLWPIDYVWDFHCGNYLGEFDSLKFFRPPLQARYGSATSAAAFLALSQAAAYESHRAMFDAYTFFKYRNSTGVIQWMLNNAFPSMIWHLWDYDHVPGGSYFGAKRSLCSNVLSCAAEATARAQLLYLPWSRTVGAINHNGRLSTLAANVSVAIFNTTGFSLWSASTRIPAIPADSAQEVLSLDEHVTTACQQTQNGSLLIRLTNGGDVNDYWISCHPDVLLWIDSTYYITRCSAYANLTDLRTTPSATLQATLTSFDNATQIITASITNTGSVTAAFVEVLLVNSTAQPPVPLRDHVLLSDNFITLLPAETRNITVSAPAYFFNHFIRITADAHALPRIDS